MKSLVLSVAVVAIVAAASEAAAVVPVGTFSNLEYRQQSGDLVGIEIKIVPTSRGYQGALLIAEGLPREFIIVPITLDQNRVRFLVPASYEQYGGTEFDGTFDGNAIQGRIMYPGGATEEVHLPKRSHWDSTSATKRPRSSPKPDARSPISK